LTQDCVAKSLSRPWTHQPRGDVLPAAGRKAHDNVHRPCRIGLRLRDPRHGRQSGSARGQMQKFPAVEKAHRVLLWPKTYEAHGLFSRGLFRERRLAKMKITDDVISR